MTREQHRDRLNRQSFFAAIFNRLQYLAQHSDSPDHKAEHQAIADALGALRVLKLDKLGFPDWEVKVSQAAIWSQAPSRCDQKSDGLRFGYDGGDASRGSFCPFPVR